MLGGAPCSPRPPFPQLSEWEIILEINNVSSNLNHKDLTCRAENVAGPAEDSVMLNVTCEQPRRDRCGVRGPTRGLTRLCLPPQFPQ